MYRSIPLVQAVSLARRTVLVAAIVASAVTTTLAAEPKGGDDVLPTREAGSQIIASDAPLWQRRTDSSYLAVFTHYCDPGMREHLAMTVEPSSIEIAIYTDRLRVEYAGDCRAFYLNEIVGRLGGAIE